LASGQGPPVLLVEDEVLLIDLLTEALDEAGYAVTPCNSSEAGKAALESGGEFMALVTDIRLGGGLDGWGLGQRAREIRPNIAVVYMTGDSAADWSARGVPLSTVITKPFAPAQVVVAIAALLNRTDDNR